MTSTRRLAAILVADVVGYSRLMEADEAGTLAALKERRKAILEPVVKEHGGRIVKLMGDGVLIEFASAVKAVEAAVELQSKFGKANDSVANDRRILLRIGINLGDVVGEGSDIYGDGVNIAARLEALGEPGGICISTKVHDEVRGKVDTFFEDMGEQMLRNIAAPVRVFQRRIGIEAPRSEANSAPSKPSIAVLPFTNMSGDPEQQYFSDGITEDIITELSRFRSVFVIARNSSFQYRDKAADIRRIGSELGARYVVEGSVRRMGGRIRITAQLIDAVQGNHLWSERFDRSIEELFNVQDEVVRSIAATAEGRLASAIVERVGTSRIANITAYALALRARRCLGVFDAEAAEPLLREALTLEPRYAQAYAWLSMVYWVRFFDDLEPITIGEAVVLAKKAVSLDDSDALCHAQLGFAYTFQGQFELADFHTQRAVDLNPADMYALGFRAHYLARAGRAEEALRLLDEIVRLDPFPPSYYWENRAVALIVKRKFEDAMVSTKRKEKSNWYDHYVRAVCLAHLGRLQEARAEIAELLRVRPTASIRDLMRGEPYKNPQDAQVIVEGLHRAGLSE